MFGCKCCRCSKSIESLDLSKPCSDNLKIKKREKSMNATEAKSYKKLRVSSFMPENQLLNGQNATDFRTSQSGPSSIGQLDCESAIKVKKVPTNLSANSSTNNPETKPKLTYQSTLYEDELANEAETLIEPKPKIAKNTDKKNKISPKLQKLEIYNPAQSIAAYNFDYNLYAIKKNISVWCIDIALLTSNGQTLKNLLNSGSHHLNFLFENKLVNNGLTLSLSDEFSQHTAASSFTTSSPSIANSTSLIDGEIERRKLNELWSFYLFMFNLTLVCSSIILQLLVGILLLLNTKASQKNPSMPKRSGECYNHLILIIILFITVINVFIVIFTGESVQTIQPAI